MGFVESYVIMLFLMRTMFAFYFLGSGTDPLDGDRPPHFLRYISSWVIMLPMVGRIFGWW
jgi:hypothetical protein